MSPTPQPNPFVAGFTCRCPRCGKGKLFAGFLTLASGCDQCALDYGFADSGDGPAVFVIFAVGIIVIGLAATVEAVARPAPFVHLMLWIPATLILSFAFLRPFKATLVALQYHHKAAPGSPQ